MPPDDRTAFDTKERPAHQADDRRNRLELLQFDEMHPRLGDSYLIKGLLASSAMAVLFGEAGSGKTFLALHIGLCIAAGEACFGYRTRRTGVVYIAAEAGRAIENRVAAAKHEVEFPESMPFAAITTPLDLCGDEVDLQRLITTVETADLGAPVGLVIVDTLSRVLGGANENSPDGMGALVKNVDLLRAETGAAVLIVHHPGKDRARGARGHSLLRAAVDTEIEIARDERTGICTARVTKQRDMPTEGAVSFRLRAVELGVDQDGDPVTSCAMDELETDASAENRPARLPAAQRRAFDLLNEAVSTAGEIPPASNHIPSNTVCVNEDLWRRYCYAGSISKGKSSSAPRMAFERAAEALLAAGWIGKWGDWVWPVRT